MSQIRPLIPLLVTAGILIGGNGLQGTYIALRGSYEGFSPSLIGMIGAGYSVGFAIGCIYVTRLLREIGHIRTFSAMAAIGASCSLAMSLIIDPTFWFLMRFIIGIAVASLFATVESWINAKVTNANRARTLSIYRLVDLGSVTAAQYMIPLAGIEGTVIFSIIAIAMTLSLVPISLADRSSPTPPEAIRFDLKAVWRISPLAVVGVVCVGLAMAAFRNIGPIYGEAIGMSITSIATFMSAGIIGGVVLQYPLGVYSDRLDRRTVILWTTIGSIITGAYLSFGAGTSETANIIGVFLFGAFSMPLYSLCSAHGNDYAKDGEHALVSAGLLFYWSVGATVGPLLASLLLEYYGPDVFFIYTSVIFAGFAVFTLRRMGTRPPVPPEERPRRFRALLRTSAYFNKLAAPPDKEDRR
ncbi:MFS permease [Pseudorhizobium banfieldiae]|uniref:MFS permease n=1 Tax=Pseudorhizobium banfieldiae TaxID=1125847 RepID=L0NCR0_9HYPH|nr:MFS transporter [Pseudorhizobium banfieldiae]CAD6604245.1 MFS transporter [arsenite-oxidising bacterium NT-25]CCF18898.1 MFS permease [Pseudorhizobium banfieldiae]